jgi:hypothetical protein
MDSVGLNERKTQRRPIHNLKMQLKTFEHLLALIVHGSQDFYRRNLYSSHHGFFKSVRPMDFKPPITMTTIHPTLSLSLRGERG